jgi:hypothetical protein
MWEEEIGFELNAPDMTPPGVRIAHLQIVRRTCVLAKVSAETLVRFHDQISSLRRFALRPMHLLLFRVAACQFRNSVIHGSLFRPPTH